TNVRAEKTGGDVVRSFGVVGRVGMKILPVFGEASAAGAVVRRTAIGGRSVEADVTKILVPGRTPGRRVLAAGATGLRTGAVHVVPDHVLNHLDAVGVQHGHHAQVIVLGS